MQLSILLIPHRLGRSRPTQLARKRSTVFFPASTPGRPVCSGEAGLARHGMCSVSVMPRQATENLAGVRLRAARLGTTRCTFSLPYQPRQTAHCDNYPGIFQYFICGLRQYPGQHEQAGEQTHRPDHGRQGRAFGRRSLDGAEGPGIRLPATLICSKNGFRRWTVAKRNKR